MDNRHSETASLVAGKLLEIEAVLLRPSQPFTWASGWHSPIYCDNRRILSYPSLRSLVAESLADRAKELFPEGLDKTVELIKQHGYRPGIWFEIENVASEARAYKLTEHLLKRDGVTLTSYFRRFWDLNDPWVRDYLYEKVIGTLKKYGFGYIKSDYNETIGIGVDDVDSLGEGLRRIAESSADFMRLIRKEIPDIVIENCASGGHRLEPLMMSLCSMASFSDAHECAEIPIIAAGLHRAIHPAQSQIWAVIRQDDSIRRIVYSLSATFLGRLCLSGDVTDLTREQWRAISDGLEFYKSAAHIIRDGRSVIYGEVSPSFRHPTGWQAVVRVLDKEALVVLHAFEHNEDEKIFFGIPEFSGARGVELIRSYSEGYLSPGITGTEMEVRLNKFEGAAFLLRLI